MNLLRKKKIRAEAEKLAEDKGKLRKFSEGAKAWLEKFRDKPVLGSMAQDLSDMIDLVNDYAEGEYTAIPKRFLAAIVGALLYVVCPLELLPGFIDDILVVSIIMDCGVSSELKKYREWKKKQMRRSGSGKETDRKKTAEEEQKADRKQHAEERYEQDKTE
ncbi:MAG: hypothetical protein K6E50_02735 [Lachnospiraceae bacterium]|nr:hypothetical protein [Lachnospiraceae bacterium]